MEIFRKSKDENASSDETNDEFSRINEALDAINMMLITSKAEAADDEAIKKDIEKSNKQLGDTILKFKVI